MSKKDFKEIIDFYFSKKKDDIDDYNLILDDEVDVDVINQSNGERVSIKSREVKTRVNLYNLNHNPVTEEDVENLNPDNINVEEFWKYAVKKFPNYSISNYEECRNEDDVNKANLNSAIWSGFIQKVEAQIKSVPNDKFLEIGPGYGGIFRHILSKYEQCNYFAIDVNPLFNYEGGLFKCDGKSIPNELGGDFNTIFSFNVFHHLSKKQRISYYKDCFNKLKKNGKFIFTNYLVVDENKDKNFLWSYKDNKGNPYTNFFTQMNPVDNYNDLADELNEIGFDVKVSLKQNLAIIECTKF